MELKWLEDVLLLMEAGSFSKAAARRNVTQPAFSRRIRALEQWLGTTLVDRSRHPLRFTQAALDSEPEIRHIVNRFHEMRSRLRAEARARKHVIFTTQHALAATHFPRLLHFLQQHDLPISFRLRSADRQECIDQMGRGEADFLLCYETPTIGTGLPGNAMRCFRLGREKLLPVTGTAAPGKPIHLPQQGEPLPLFVYPEHSFLGQVLREQLLPHLLKTYDAETVCESAFSEGIKEMVLGGLGIAWLPYSLIEKELRQGKLHALDGSLGSCEMDIALHGREAASSPETKLLVEVLNDAVTIG